MPKNRKIRSASRELLVRLVFAAGVPFRGRFPSIDEFMGCDPDSKLFAPAKGIAPDTDYIAKTLTDLKENHKHIDKLIESASEKWTLRRIAKTDLSVLRVAVTEMLYAIDINDAVSISEAVRLAERYGTSESKAFVNGVLGKIASDRSPE